MSIDKPKDSDEPSPASDGSAPVAMTSSEFFSRYGEESVTFAEYYKYTFHFRATLPDGRTLVVGYGGDSEQIYRFRVKAPGSVKVRDLLPFFGSVYDGEREVESFWEC